MWPKSPSTQERSSERENPAMLNRISTSFHGSCKQPNKRKLIYDYKFFCIELKGASSSEKIVKIEKFTPLPFQAFPSI